MNINIFFFLLLCLYLFKNISQVILFSFIKILILSFEIESISISKTIVDTVQAASQEDVCHKQCFSSIYNKGFVLLVSAPVSFCKIKSVCRCESIPRLCLDLFCQASIGSLCSNHITLPLDIKLQHQEILVFLVYLFSHSGPFSCGFYKYLANFKYMGIMNITLILSIKLSNFCKTWDISNIEGYRS